MVNIMVNMVNIVVNIVVKSQSRASVATEPVRRHAVARTKNDRRMIEERNVIVATPSPRRRPHEERTGNATSEFLSKSDFGAICVQIYTISDRKSARLTSLEGSLERGWRGL
jgi:hypothetical protein